MPDDLKEVLLICVQSAWICGSKLNVEVPYVERVVFDELAPWLNSVAHQHSKDLVSFDHIVDPDLEQRALLGIHRRFPKLLRVHLAQTFVALDRQILLRCGQHFLEQRFARRNLFTTAILTRRKWRRQIVFERLVQLNRFLKLDELREVPVNDEVHTRSRYRLDFPESMLLIGR